MAVTPARNVAARCLHRDDLLTCDKAGNNLKRDVCHRGFLRLSEVAHVVVCKCDVVFQLLRDLGGSCRNILGRQQNGTVPLIELGGIAQGRFIATGLNVIKDTHHRCTHIACIGLSRFRRFFQIFPRHERLVFKRPRDRSANRNLRLEINVSAYIGSVQALTFGL